MTFTSNFLHDAQRNISLKQKIQLLFRLDTDDANDSQELNKRIFHLTVTITIV